MKKAEPCSPAKSTPLGRSSYMILDNSPERIDG